MTEQLLKVNSLKSGYGDFQALFDVSIDVHAGEVVAVIGANGAGKSTLLKSIAGLLKNQPDSILMNRKPIGALRADQVAHCGIALVPEGRQLFPSLSIEENLKLGATVGRKGYWSLESVYRLFPILQERRHAPADTLSGGQQQMAAIGRALMANPALILFDEISLGLAPVVINDIYETLPGIVEQGTTSVLVEQDISRALSVASRFYCLQEGRVTLNGKPRDVTREQIVSAYFGVAA